MVQQLRAPRLLNGLILAVGAFFSATSVVAAATEQAAESGAHGDFAIVFLLVALLLFVAKLGGAIEKFGQPAVLGELIAGIGLSVVGFFGLPLVDGVRTNEVVTFLAELGAVILLFQIGLESNIAQLAKVGPRAFLVAILGVVCPFLLGYLLVGPVFFPEATTVTHLFIGAALVATSVGITASVFKSLGILSSRAAQTVLGAAVIDDVLGLLVLAIVSAIAKGSSPTPTDIAFMAGEAIVFLGVSIAAGHFLTKHISKAFSKIHTGTGMKLSLAFIFALGYSYAATLVGLAPIIGAFAAGLVLDAVDFDFFDGPVAVKKLEGITAGKHSKQIAKVIQQLHHSHIEDMIASLSLIFVPLFFAYTGLSIDVHSLLNPQVYILALVTTVIAVAGKLVSGLAASGKLSEKLLVGVSMVPRGEVGLIFAATGKALGAISDEVFSMIVLVVICTTVIAPSLITIFSRRLANAN